MHENQTYKILQKLEILQLRLICVPFSELELHTIQLGRFSLDERDLPEFNAGKIPASTYHNKIG